MASSRAFNVKSMRGHILKMLAAFYPNGVTGVLVYREAVGRVFPEADWPDAVRQLTYLVERGYVAHVHGFERSRSARERMYRVTTTGIDLVEGVTTDDGIEIEV